VNPLVASSALKVAIFDAFLIAALIPDHVQDTLAAPRSLPYHSNDRRSIQHIDARQCDVIAFVEGHQTYGAFG
jgi:hypothetical protein